MARSVTLCDVVDRSHSGAKRTWRGHSQSFVHDPKRHFATINYCIAKGSFALDVGRPTPASIRWRGKGTAGPFHLRISDYWPSAVLR